MEGNGPHRITRASRRARLRSHAPPLRRPSPVCGVGSRDDVRYPRRAVTDRCDLCGARWLPTYETCPECGASRTGPEATTADAEDTTESLAFEATPIEQPVPRAPSDDEVDTPRRLRRLLVALVAVAGMGLGGFVLLGKSGARAEAPTADEPSACDRLDVLSGTWAFTTEVTGARSDQKLGLRGFYRLEVDVQGCIASARLVKTGFGNRRFSDEQLQRDERTLDPGQGAFAFGHGAVFALRDAAGNGPDQEFVFQATGDRLHGTWRQRGALWAKSRLHGYLEGSRDAEPRAMELQLSAQPCAVQCAVACGAAEHDGATLPPGLDACEARCAVTGTAPPGCGADS